MVYRYFLTLPKGIQRRPGDKGCSVRMQQEHFGKYNVLEWGEKLSRQTDRQALTSLPAESHSRLLIPPDANSRLCFTFTSICREREKREKQQQLSAVSDFSLSLSAFLLQTFPLMPPPLCVCLARSRFLSLSHFLSHFLSPSFPTSLFTSVILSEALLRLPLLCSPILF